MRHFLLALLIALLPIRGWMGNAMALSTVGVATATQAAQAMADDQEWLDCQEHSPAVHAAAHATGDAPAEDVANAHHDTPHHTADADEPSHAHGACEVCNGPAMALGWPTGMTLPQSQAMARTPAVRFASTVLPQGVKPPIS